MNSVSRVGSKSSRDIWNFVCHVWFLSFPKSFHARMQNYITCILRARGSSTQAETSRVPLGVAREAMCEMNCNSDERKAIIIRDETAQYKQSTEPRS